jgi:hypothetical protein
VRWESTLRPIACRAPRLIDFGLIEVLNETVWGEDMTIASDDGQIIATGMEKWAHLSRDYGKFYGPRLQAGESDQVVS